jgi:hypothetical protein
MLGGARVVVADSLLDQPLRFRQKDASFGESATKIAIGRPSLAGSECQIGTSTSSGHRKQVAKWKLLPGLFFRRDNILIRLWSRMRSWNISFTVLASSSDVSPDSLTLCSVNYFELTVTSSTCYESIRSRRGWEPTKRFH